MKNLLSFTGAAVAATLLVSPVQAGKGDNALPAGAPAAPAIAPGDLGMSIMSAVVNADGTLARGEGVLSAAPVGAGDFEVIFGRDVRPCTYVATVGSSATSGTEPGGYATVVGRAGTPAGIFLETFDTAGTNVARGFHVVVYCGR